VFVGVGLLAHAFVGLVLSDQVVSKNTTSVQVVGPCITTPATNTCALSSIVPLILETLLMLILVVNAWACSTMAVVALPVTTASIADVNT